MTDSASPDLAGVPTDSFGVLGPRLVIAGTQSGVGKTTVATGLMAAWTAAGLRVAPAKVGPDFIDPGYHALATGAPGRNLDAFLSGAAAIAPLAARAARGADVLVIEGVMGLFDGVGATSEASTADVAITLDAPVVLVVDESAISASVAALVHGFCTHRPELRLSGVILNRVGSDTHEELLREALAPLHVPVLGALRRDDAFAWRDRHLGLVPVAEHPDDIRRSLAHLAAAVAARLDLAALWGIARGAPAKSAAPLAPTRRTGAARVAVASGPAFTFAYPDNLERMIEAGAEILPFDPLVDRSLPSRSTGLYVGGGFPEVYGAGLSENTSLLEDDRLRTGAGLPTWAECGGLLWLSRSLDGKALCGAIPADAHMTERLTLGYRHATLHVDSPVAAKGSDLRGHEFHYSTTDPPGDAATLSGRSGTVSCGYASSTLFASYLHLHLGATPEPAERFVVSATPSR